MYRITLAAHVDSSGISRTVEVIEQTMQRSLQLSLALFVRHDKDRLEIDGQTKPDHSMVIGHLHKGLLQLIILVPYDDITTA